MKINNSDDFNINRLLEDIDLINATQELNASVDELLRFQIAYLQSQIKPHFLYNVINTISAYSLDDPKMARELLSKFSLYLRSTLDFKNRDRLITLRKELELVESYLFIEKARFGERLKIVYDIEANLDCMLPPLILQSLAENAVQNGLEAHKLGGTVKISARREKSFVSISVEEEGTGITESNKGKPFDEEECCGIELKNINQRLFRLYGKGLEYERIIGGGTKAVICIPIKR